MSRAIKWSIIFNDLFNLRGEIEDYFIRLRINGTIHTFKSRNTVHCINCIHAIFERELCKTFAPIKSIYLEICLEEGALMSCNIVRDYVDYEITRMRITKALQVRSFFDPELDMLVNRLQKRGAKLV